MRKVEIKVIGPDDRTRKVFYKDSDDDAGIAKICNSEVKMLDSGPQAVRITSSHMSEAFIVSEAEVKTIYHLKLTPNIFCKMIGQMRAMHKKIDPDNFFGIDIVNREEGFTLAESTQLLKDIFKMGINCSPSAVNFITTKILNFDGVENYGWYDWEEGAAFWSAYSYGDQLTRKDDYLG